MRPSSKGLLWSGPGRKLPLPLGPLDTIARIVASSTKLGQYPSQKMSAKLTPAACRAARGLLEWGVRDLAREAEMSHTTVGEVERGREFSEKTAEKIIAAFARHGVEITNGEGTGARLLAKRSPKRGATRPKK